MKKAQIHETTATKIETRRDLIKRVAVMSMGVSAVAAGILNLAQAKADSHVTQVDENSPMATALGYKHNAANVDGTKYPQSQGGNKNCESCQLYKAGTEAGWGGCAIFAGKLVNGKGWCSAWVPIAKG